MQAVGYVKVSNLRHYEAHEYCYGHYISNDIWTGHATYGGKRMLANSDLES
jgi:hypothetical protein